MNIVCFGLQSWGDPWSSRQHLPSRLARRGHRVLYVNPRPEGPAPGAGAAIASWRNRVRIHDVQDGLHVLTLRPPPQRLPARWARALQRTAVRAAAEHLGLWAPVAICHSPQQRWLLDSVRPAATIYFAEGRGTAVPEPGEAELLGQCDLVLAGNQALLERLNRVQPRCHLQEEGVDVEQFRPAAMEGIDRLEPLASLPRPRLGFLGDIDATYDHELLLQLARRFPRAAVVVAGRLAEDAPIASLRTEPNVIVMGDLQPRQFGAVYRELDVGLAPGSGPGTPRGGTTSARLFEYLAADLPTVAVGGACPSSAVSAVRVADSREEFLEAVGEALQDPDGLRDQRRRVAEAASWQRRADQLEERLNEAMSLASVRWQRHREAPPRPDRRGRRVVRVEPRLDGKDASVRLLHDNYRYNGLSPQQNAMYLLSRVLGLSYYCFRLVWRLARGDASAVRRILVVRNGHLGDTVVFLPTLAALRARFPRARITVAVAPGSGAQPLLEASPYVDEVLPLDFFNRSRRDRFFGAARLLARGFDLAVGGVWYFHLPEAVFSGAPLRLGLYDGHPLQRYADRVVMLDPNLHEAENNLRLVELVTGPLPRELRVPRLKLDEPTLAAKAQEMRRRLGIGPDTPVVAMHPGSKRPSRRWPAERFTELANLLLSERPQLHVACTGAGADEEELIRTIASNISPGLRDRFHNAVGASDLVGVIGFYDTCRLLVCNDTGVMHVARARGVPLVAIIGPENDRRWGPHPLGPAPAVAIRQQVPGTPHGKWSCPWNLSLASIDAGRVKRHVDALLDGSFEQVNHVTPTGAGRLYPLVPDVRRLSFAQLLEMGLALPKADAILTSDPALLGAEGTPVDAATLAAAARAMRRQIYPMIHTLIVTDQPDELAGLDIGQADVIGVAPGDPDAAWAAVMAATDGSLIWPTTAGPYPSPAISSRVSVFLRGPHASVMDGERAWPVRTLLTGNLLSGRWLLTRSALEEMLVHPVPVPDVKEPEDAHAPLEAVPA